VSENAPTKPKKGHVERERAHLNARILAAEEEKTLAIRVGDGEDVAGIGSGADAIDTLEVSCAPYPSGPIPRGTEEEVAIGGEGEGEDAPRVPEEFGGGLEGLEVPYLWSDDVSEWVGGMLTETETISG
jgi:hypothetical protein